jgi:peptide/nickel transport system substrate-binding protein
MNILPFAALLLAGAAAPCGTAVIPNSIGQAPPSPVTSLNPLLTQSIANNQITELLFRPLVWIGEDDRMDAARSLAASITPLDGNTRLRILLKPWRWSDGVPVTADDAVYTWERIVKLGELFAFIHQGGIPDRVAAVHAVDEHSVDFVFKAPINPDWVELNGLSNFPPLPRHAWGDLGPDEMWPLQTEMSLARVVDGPFMLTELHLDQFAVLVPNPLYGGAPAHLARLVVEFMEGSHPLAALRSGELDMTHVPLALWDADKRLPGFKAIILPEPFGYTCVIYNFGNDAVSFIHDARVRRALTDASDQNMMVKVVYHGLSDENRVVVPVAPPTWRSPAARSGNLPVRGDKALARAELEAAGWRVGADGIRQKNGKRLAFSLMTRADVPERMEMLQIWQSDLRSVGIELSIRPVTFMQIEASLNCACNSWEALVESATWTGIPDGSGHFDTGGDLNGGYSNAHMDALIRASVEQPGAQGLFAYEDYAAQEQPVTILPQGEFPLLFANRLGGVAEFVNPQGYWAPEELFVTDEGCLRPDGGALR